jgi:hypothetical protein
MLVHRAERRKSDLAGPPEEAVTAGAHAPRPSVISVVTGCAAVGLRVLALVLVPGSLLLLILVWWLQSLREQ